MYSIKTIKNEISKLNKNYLLRSLKNFSVIKGTLEQEKKIINFSSNDYLNLSNSSILRENSTKYTNIYGCSATASRLVCGNIPPYEIIENSISKLIGKESSLVFGSGYLANLGIINTIANRGDEIFSDKYNHASLIDGISLSKVKHYRYKHKDIKHLEFLLSKSNASGKNIIISDSVFSMDGDIAPIKELVELSEKYNAMLIIDEAHAIGIFGNGGGVVKELGLTDKVDIILGTLSKSIGSYGGFAAISCDLREYLINKTRTLIYTTGLPASVLGASIAGVNHILGNIHLGRLLLSNASFFCDCLIKNNVPIGKFESHIIPIHIGDNLETIRISERLLNEFGICSIGIRPPTVPIGTSRLRLSVTLKHTTDELAYAAYIIAKFLNCEE